MRKTALSTLFLKLHFKSRTLADNVRPRNRVIDQISTHVI